MKTTIYLIRHGETSWNVGRRVQGNYNGPDQSILTENGIKQAELLKKRMTNVKIDIVYSSPLKRAMQTTSIVFPDKKTNPNPKLVERSFGEWETLYDSQIDEKWPGKRQYYTETKEFDDVKGGESSEHLGKRGAEAIKEIAAAHPGKTIAVVSHGGIIRAIIGKLLHYSREETIRMKFENTAICVIEFEEGLGIVRIPVINDHAHLIEDKDNDRE